MHAGADRLVRYRLDRVRHVLVAACQPAVAGLSASQRYRPHTTIRSSHCVPDLLRENTMSVINDTRSTLEKHAPLLLGLLCVAGWQGTEENALDRVRHVHGIALQRHPFVRLSLSCHPRRLARACGEDSNEASRGAMP
jgi:hypothetical protein